MKLAVTGCPRNCAEALCKDLGVVAVDGGRWEIYVGGAAGAHIRKGDLLATVDDPDEVITLDRPLPAVLPGERATGSSAPTRSCRASASTRSAPSSSTTARASPTQLDADMQKSVDAYRDPWQDGRSPVTPGPVPHVAAAAAAPPGAGPMTDVEVGAVDEIPLGEGRTFAVDGGADRGVPAARRLAAGPRCGVPAPGRPAGRRPRSTTAWWSARCTATPSTWAPAPRLVGPTCRCAATRCQRSTASSASPPLDRRSWPALRSGGILHACALSASPRQASLCWLRVQRFSSQRWSAVRPTAGHLSSRRSYSMAKPTQSTGKSPASISPTASYSINAAEGAKKLIRVRLGQENRLVVEAAGFRFNAVNGFTNDSNEAWATKVDNTYAISGRMPPDDGQTAAHQFKIEVTCARVEEFRPVPPRPPDMPRIPRA